LVTYFVFWAKTVVQGTLYKKTCFFVQDISNERGRAKYQCQASQKQS
jgi:hypothetical protein